MNVKMKFAPKDGAPITEKEARAIGPDLLRIAEEHNTADVRSIDKHDVYAWVKAHPRSALAKWIFRTPREAAADAYYLELCRRVVGYVKVVTVHLPQGEPLFVRATKAPVRIVEKANRRAEIIRGNRSVLRADLLKDEPSFMSALGLKIRSVRDQFVSLERLVLSRPSPREIRKLVAQIRGALNEYENATKDDAAE